jgi:serine/threonine-protein kinase
MSVTRWQQVESIAAVAIEHTPAERMEFLTGACGGDEALQREVESLLEFAPMAESFLQRTAIDEAARIAVGADDGAADQIALAGYETGEMLGIGGMGEVYRARDLRLQRDVAIKVIHCAGRSDSARQVEQEARAASALNHPNIVTIHSVALRDDVAFIVMELVSGRTLRAVLREGVLPLPAGLDIAVQLADGLTAAHANGVVHRDLKPDNVMVTADGLVKILDFGIATRAGGSDTRMFAGTAGYMSPEQAARQPVDHRADQFSLGAILYEMVSGQRAFTGASKAETIDAVIRTEPAPIRSVSASVPAVLVDVIERCLRKDPGQRYADTRGLATQLRRIRDGIIHPEERRQPGRRQAILLVAAAAVGAIGAAAAWRFRAASVPSRRLAILPFQNLAGDEGTQALAVGIPDTLNSQLTGLTGLVVLGRNTVSQLGSQPRDPRDIGRQVDADLVFTGKIDRRGDKAIIDVELADGRTGARLWGASFKPSEADVLAVQNDIAARIITDGLRLQLSEPQRAELGRRLPADAEAYRLFLQAVQLFRREGESNYLEARKLLEKAVARDDRFALGHVTLASTYSAMAVDGYEDPREAWPLSHLHVTRALALDQNLPDGHAERAMEAFFYDRDPVKAKGEWDLALQGHDGEVQAELYTSYVLQLWALGRTEEGLRFARAARKIDPLSPMLATREADMLAAAGDYQAAATVYEKRLSDNPDERSAQSAHAGLASVRYAQDRFDEAIGELWRAVASGDPQPADLRGRAGYLELERRVALFELEGLKDRTRAGLYASSYDFARVYARLGDAENAFRHLGTAFEEKAPGLMLIKVDPSWANLRSNPELIRAVERAGLTNKEQQ